MIEINARFPPKLECLFQPKRYKVLYGGRGGAKSWSVARALLLLGAEKRIQILCAREQMNSIRDSVHKLLSQQILAFGLESVYDIQQSAIRGKNGTEFSFEGIRHNIGKIKSYEGIDYCWVEEAQSVSASSWEILIPTIRKPGSEIWITFNPDLETDETYQRFVINPPPNSSVVFINWRDNEWFPQELKDEMEYLKVKDHDKYLHIWEGHCKAMLEGAVYAEELREATVQNRVTQVSYDRSVPVSTYWDLGRSDHTSIWFAQQVGWEYHLVDFYQSNLKHIDHYIKTLQNRPYVYDTHWLPHDAKAKTLGSRMSIEEQARAKLSTVRIVPKLSVPDKINAARTVFPNCWFDQKRCAEGLQALRHYRYDVDAVTRQFSKVPLHDENSDAANAFEYFGVACKQPGKRSRLKSMLPARLLSPESWFEPIGGEVMDRGDAWMG